MNWNFVWHLVLLMEIYQFSLQADGGWDASRIDQAHPVGVTSVLWAPSTAPGALVGSGLLDPVQKLCSGGCDNTDVSWAPNLGLPKSTLARNILAVADGNNNVTLWEEAVDGEWQQVTVVEP
ncbi:hypothetical protein CRYUN_Cryun34aG0073700 [Craigia yunnanensis]